ncbi:unnamed protein product [Prorocentrum cordatum]|uniref:TsaA-like domain-containing protein n=1 Tax=Prorocentrum cordatum TaxID=2364126 RepID=A0ABN9PXA0_9DINO|nr:unnamed protein product [Polarella glacialis]
MHRNHRNIQGEELPARIRPPSGGQKQGLLATRAPHRPCGPLGLSCLRIEDIRVAAPNTTGSRRNKCVLAAGGPGGLDAAAAAAAAERRAGGDPDGDPSAVAGIEENYSVRIEVSNLDILDNAGRPGRRTGA